MTQPAEAVVTPLPEDCLAAATPAQVMQAMISVNYYAALANEDIEPITEPVPWLVPLDQAVELLRCDGDRSMRMLRRQFEAKQKLAPQPNERRNATIGGFPNALTGGVCCSTISCTVDHSSKPAEPGAIDYTIYFHDPNATTAAMAPYLDARNWDDVTGSWFADTYYAYDACPTTRPDANNVPVGSPPTTLLGGSIWPGVIFEHYADGCPVDPNTCTAFKNLLAIETERGVPANDYYHVAYRLCAPPSGSLTTQVLTTPGNEERGGIVTDCGYTAVRDRSSGLAKISGEKRLGFCPGGNTTGLNQMVALALQTLVEATAISLCDEIGASGSYTCNPTKCHNSNGNLPAPDVCAKERPGNCP